MKILVSFEKTSIGQVEAKIEIMSADDYTTTRLFTADTHYPNSEHYILGAGSEDMISSVLETPIKAQDWAKTQIEALRKHLNIWRGIQVPEDYEITI